MVDDSAAFFLPMRLGKRVAEIAATEQLNQKSFAKSLGVSQGFLSSVFNDQKVPGGEFLYALKMAFGVNIDWVLTGEGSMYGGKKINIQLQKEIRLYIAVARAAVIDAHPSAKALLVLIQENRLQEATQDEILKLFLNELVYQDADFELLTTLYNNCVEIKDTETQRLKVIAAAIEYFELRAPVNFFTDALGQSASSLQINIGTKQTNILNHHKK